MSADTVLPMAARPVLSEGVRVALLQAFTGEVAERLPHLRELAAGADVDLERACRDAHTLASSAWVVGFPETSSAARELEGLLSRRRDGEDVDLTLPLARLVDLLEGPR